MKTNCKYCGGEHLTGNRPGFYFCAETFGGWTTLDNNNEPVRMTPMKRAIYIGKQITTPEGLFLNYGMTGEAMRTHLTVQNRNDETSFFFQFFPDGTTNQPICVTGFDLKISQD